MNEAVRSTDVPNTVGVDQHATFKTVRLVLALVFGFSAVTAIITLRNNTTGGWGMFTATYLFLQGLTQYGIAFTAIMRLTGGFWARPIFRLAEITTLAFFPISIIGLLVIYFAARQQLFFWLSPEPGEHLSSWLNEDKLLIRSLLAQFVFYVFAYLYVRIGLRPDLDSQKVAAATGLRKFIFGLFGGAGGESDPVKLTDRLYKWSVPMLMIAALANTFSSWDFAMMLWPHYHSTIFTLYYMVGCLFGGTAMLLLLAAWQKRFVNMETVFGIRQVKNIGIMLTGFMCLWLYFFWAQYFVSWFGNLPDEMRPLNAQMQNHYAPFFWTSVGCLFLLPLTFLIFARVKRSLLLASIVATLIVTGTWLNRYLMVLPAQWESHVPFSTIGGASGTIALISGFLLLLLVLFDVFPMLSRWEIEHIPAAERKHWHSPQ